MVVHGIPGAYELKRGDLISLDVGVIYEGWVADAGFTLPVGPVSEPAMQLLEATRDALFRGIAEAKPATTSATSPPRSRSGSSVTASR